MSKTIGVFSAAGQESVESQPTVLRQINRTDFKLLNLIETSMFFTCFEIYYAFVNYRQILDNSPLKKFPSISHARN